MPPDMKKIAADCYRRGNEAVAKENWDYAIQMYGQAAKMVPDNLMFRQALRASEQKKYNGNGTGGSMTGMRLMSVRGKIKKARYNKDWKVVAEEAEDGLTVNPWDPQLNADLGDAAKELGYIEVAIFAYEESLKADPKNVPINESLALILEERGEYQRATECWQRILKVEPLNGKARSKITGLSASSVMDRGGYEGAESTRNVMADHEIQKRLGGGKEAADGPGMSVEADLQRAIRKDPANKDNYMKLADWYKREGELTKSEEQFKKALEVSGGNINIREMLEDVQLDMMRQSLSTAKSAAAESPDNPELKQQASALDKELVLREIEIYSGRVDRYPQDMRIKFDLAERLYRVKRFTAAIPLFQKSRSDVRIKGKSLILLGKCFLKEGKAQLARRQFEDAIPELNFDEEPDAYKDLFYTLGRLCEEMKDLPKAENYYQEVLGVDYDYKDTVARLDKLQERKDEEPS